MSVFATPTQRAPQPSSSEGLERATFARASEPTSNVRGEYIDGLRSNPVIPELYSNIGTSSLSGLQRLSTEQKCELNGIINEINRSGRLSPELRQEVMEQLVRDLTHPEEINQGVHATCVSSSVQTDLLARQRPLEYARMVADLAVTGECSFNDPSKSRVKLDSVALERDSLHVPPPYQERNITERMMQNVLVKYAIGQTVEAGANAELRYDQKTDTIVGVYQNTPVSVRGLFDDHVARLHQGVTGKMCDAIYTDSDYSRAHATLNDQLDQGKGVLVQMRWASSGVHQLHALVVQNIDEKRGIVELYNPHGATNPPPVPGAIQTIKLGEFRERLSCVFAETKVPNNGKLSFVPPTYVSIERAARRGDQNPEAPIMLHVTPPQATDGSLPESSNSKPSVSQPNFRVVEPMVERHRELRQEHGTAGAEQSGQASVSKREQTAARSGYKIPGKDDDLFF